MTTNDYSGFEALNPSKFQRRVSNNVNAGDLKAKGSSLPGLSLLVLQPAVRAAYGRLTREDRGRADLGRVCLFHSYDSLQR